jgi:hypothetical protein
MGLVMGTLASGLSANVLSDEKAFKTSQFWRQVARVGLSGSAAVSDHEVQLWFGKRQIAILHASTVGSDIMPTDDDMKPISEPALCPPGEELILQVTDAPATYALNWCIEIKELPNLGKNPARPYFNRRAY